MRALEGLRIVVTRAGHQAEKLAAALRALGAEVILLPTIGIAPPRDPGPLREAVARADDYDWILFTSVNGVAAFTAELKREPRFCKARIATVGAATRQAAEERGFTVSLTPEKYVAEGLIEAFGNEDLNGRWVLIPSAAVTRDVVPRELRSRGAHVDVVEAYRNELPPGTAERARTVFETKPPDWVLFASGSAVDNLIHLTGVEAVRRTRIGSIGPITSEAVNRHGLTVAAEAKVHTIDGLMDAISEAVSMH